MIQALNSGDKTAAMNHLEAICRNVERSDWADNIFAGLVYYMLGENEKAIERVEININFDFGMKTSKAVLDEMKSGKMDIKSLSEKLSGLNADVKRLNTENVAPAVKLRRAEVLLQQKAGDKNIDEYKRMADIYYSTKEYKRTYVWYYVYGQRPMYEEHGFIMRTILQLFYNVTSLGGILFNWPYNEVDLIEGEGVFNWGKLDDNDIMDARKGAMIILRTIQARLIANSRSE